MRPFLYSFQVVVVEVLLCLFWQSITWADEVIVGSSRELTGFSSEEFDQVCWDQFLRDAPISWEKLEGQLRGFQVDIVFDQTWKLGTGELNSLNEWTASVSNDGKSIHITDKSSLAITSVNEKYSFRVNPTQEENQFMLNKVQPIVPGESSILFGALSYYHEIMSYVHSIWWVPLEYILENLGEDKFKVVAAHFVQDNEHATIARIAFKYLGSIKEKPYCEPGAIYWAELLPLQSWVVIRSGVSFIGQGNNKLRVRVISTYQDWFAGDVFPKHVVLAYENLSEKRIIEVRKADLNRIIPLEIPAKEFYLPYYGIPETVVHGLDKGTTKWRIYLNLLAILVFTLAVLLNRYIKFRSRSVEN